MNVSIVIPVYNEADYLGDCLESVARQTVQPHEVIVVDNNSTDSSSKIASRYEFVRIIQEPQQGIVFARNAGFAAATGDVLARIDADSRVPKDWIEQLGAQFQANPSVAAVSGSPDFYNVPHAGFFNAMQVLLYQKFQRLLSGTYTLWGANMAIRQEAWKAVAVSCSTRADIDEDVDLTLCLRHEKLRIAYLPALPVGVSLQRDNWGFGNSVRYLSSWPRDYRIHKLRLRALILYVVLLAILVLRLPLMLFLGIRSKPAG